MNNAKPLIRRSVAVFLASIAMACATDTTAPLTPEPEAHRALSAGAQKGQTTATVNAVGRLGHHGADVTVSATIGAEGGTLTIPSMGFTLIVPPGAVAAPTRFSATAIAGRAVAYDFRPHGVVFAVPLVFRQDIRFTNFGWGQKPLGGYFPDRSAVNGKTGKAQVVEQMPAWVSGPFIEFNIHHFSGYLVSCA